MNNSQPRRSWWKRILIGLVMLTITTVLSRWIMYEIEKAQGEEELAAAIAETEALDPRWRWEQIEKDRPVVAEDENSMLAVKKFDECRGKWDPSAIKLPGGEDLLPKEFDNLHLDQVRIAFIRKQLTEQRAAVDLAKSPPSPLNAIALPKANGRSNSTICARAICRPCPPIPSMANR